MAETLKTIWVVERRTDVGDWHPYIIRSNRIHARMTVADENSYARRAYTGWTYRVAKYVRAKA